MAGRAKRTIAATPGGLKQIEEKRLLSGKTAQEIGDFAGVSRSSAQKFFKGQPISVTNFQSLCEQLGLDWQEIAGLKGALAAPPAEHLLKPGELDALVERARSRGKTDIEERCGWMKVLDMQYRIGVGVIYTDVNILEKITGRSRREIEELMQGCTPDDFDRSQLGRVREERVDGLKAVQDKKQLMILGRPGAGKTTFLKRLAALCNQGTFLPKQVPIFVTLKEFAETVNQPGLLKFISDYFAPSLSTEEVNCFLKQGRGLVLLDGLDEVLERNHDRVLREIEGFTQVYGASHIIITCRIAAREYVFQQFTDVQMADFSDEQILDFADKWFKVKEPNNLDEEGNSKVAKLFWEELEAHEPIKELATNPLLLTLLCLEFEQSAEFPQSRAVLYERALNVLLSKWDGQRQIKRDEVYKRLPINRKENLLGQLARYTFERGDYFFREHLATQRIGDYIQNLPDASSDPEALLVDSRAVLRSIEAQHGLLTERATGIYSFSHLTFHEYFTARNILDSPDTPVALQQLVEHLHEKRWREVFLLIAERLEPADHLLAAMKQQTDQMLTWDEKLQDFLIWVAQKSSSVEAPYKPAAIRAFYLGLDLDLDFDLNLARNVDFDFDFVPLALDLDLTHALNFARARARNLDSNLDLTLKRNLALDGTLDLTLAHAHARAHGSELQLTLQELREQSAKFSKENREQFKHWWRTQGQAWAEQLRTIMIEHRNIGYDWQFSDDQRNLLVQYYKANLLLVQCLNNSYVTKETRQRIEVELLLPVSHLRPS